MKPGFVFYSTLAVVGSFAVFFLVAALRRELFFPAQKRTLEFLDSYLNAMPDWALKWARTAGGATGFVLLVALTFAFDGLGNSHLERVKPVLSHGNGLHYLAWQVDHVDLWQQKLGQYRVQWSKDHPGKDWEEHNSAELKKWQCRVPRTLFFFSLLLLFAGVIDIILPGFRKRGLVIAVIAIFSSFLTLTYYGNRENHYVYEVLTHNQELTAPVVFPDELTAGSNSPPTSRP